MENYNKSLSSLKKIETKKANQKFKNKKRLNYTKSHKAKCSLLFLLLLLLKYNNIKLSNFIIDKPQKLFLFREDKEIVKNKQKIHIAMSLDNNLVYPTLVSMTSGCANNNENLNILVYYLLLSYDFNKTNIEIFESLKMNYSVEIHYYIIPPRFRNLRRWRSGDCIYYKLLLPILLPNLKRIIFLDGDTLIYKDLSDMYKLDFKDNYILGYPSHIQFNLGDWGKKIVNYINAGVMLINIEKIIKNNKDFGLLDFSSKYNKRLYFPEQDGINIFFYPKVGLLPLKYGLYLFGNITIFQKFVKKYVRTKINETELSEAINDPAVVHFSCCYPKIWSISKINCFADTLICKRFHRDFYVYANKTNYYSKIYKMYVK